MNGLFWWAFPALLVITNDVMAYIFGVFFGKKLIKKPFLSLSPNKTWEGFLGAGISTVVMGFFLPLLLMWFGREWFCCPSASLSITPFPEPLTCTLPDIFIPRSYRVPQLLRNLVGPTISLVPIQLHGIIYGVFASVVAPFGGFFASAIKRTYVVKDFESFIPGHGGLMDRMDCQFFMCLFVHIYCSTFVYDPLSPVYEQAKMLSMKDQQRLVAALSR